MSVSMVDFDVVGWTRAGNAMISSCGAIGLSSAFGVVMGGRDWTGSVTGVGGTRVGAVETSDQCGVAGRARCGRQAGSVGSMILPSFRTSATGTERLGFRE